jgi:hypothetical protein
VAGGRRGGIGGGRARALLRRGERQEEQCEGKDDEDGEGTLGHGEYSFSAAFLLPSVHPVKPLFF